LDDRIKIGTIFKLIPVLQLAQELMVQKEVVVLQNYSVDSVVLA
jgi:hypothetical protein